MLQCGLLGRTLSHSLSPELHRFFGDYSYTLYEKQEDEIPDFLRCGKWDAINVTVPYKKTVLPYLDELSPTARRVGSVNVILREPGNRLTGYNTDVQGFEYMLSVSGVSAKGRKTLILGSGGASAAVCAALENVGASSVVISRSGDNNYNNLQLHSDARLLINATPVGMYPDVDATPLDLRVFSCLEGVLDLIYNPPRTKLLLQAEGLGVPAVNGLYMLVEQARLSAELFMNTPLPASETKRIIQIMKEKRT